MAGHRPHHINIKRASNVALHSSSEEKKSIYTRTSIDHQNSQESKAYLRENGRCEKRRGGM